MSIKLPIEKSINKNLYEQNYISEELYQEVENILNKKLKENNI